jgi:hypothetical protein
MVIEACFHRVHTHLEATRTITLITCIHIPVVPTIVYESPTTALKQACSHPDAATAAAAALQPTLALVQDCLSELEEAVCECFLPWHYIINIHYIILELHFNYLYVYVAFQFSVHGGRPQLCDL